MKGSMTSKLEMMGKLLQQQQQKATAAQDAVQAHKNAADASELKADQLTKQLLEVQRSHQEKETLITAAELKASLLGEQLVELQRSHDEVEGRLREEQQAAQRQAAEAQRADASARHERQQADAAVLEARQEAIAAVEQAQRQAEAAVLKAQQEAADRLRTAEEAVANANQQEADALLRAEAAVCRAQQEAADAQQRAGDATAQAAVLQQLIVEAQQQLTKAQQQAAEAQRRADSEVQLREAAQAAKAQANVQVHKMQDLLYHARVSCASCGTLLDLLDSTCQALSQAQEQASASQQALLSHETTSQNMTSLLTKQLLEVQSCRHQAEARVTEKEAHISQLQLQVADLLYSLKEVEARLGGQQLSQQQHKLVQSQACAAEEAGRKLLVTGEQGVELAAAAVKDVKHEAQAVRELEPGEIEEQQQAQQPQQPQQKPQQEAEKEEEDECCNATSATVGPKQHPLHHHQSIRSASSKKKLKASLAEEKDKVEELRQQLQEAQAMLAQQEKDLSRHRAEAKRQKHRHITEDAGPVRDTGTVWDAGTVWATRRTSSSVPYFTYEDPSHFPMIEDDDAPSLMAEDLLPDSISATDRWCPAAQ